MPSAIIVSEQIENKAVSEGAVGGAGDAVHQGLPAQGQQGQLHQ